MYMAFKYLNCWQFCWNRAVTNFGSISKPEASRVRCLANSAEFGFHFYNIRPQIAWLRVYEIVELFLVFLLNYLEQNYLSFIYNIDILLNSIFY